MKGEEPIKKRKAALSKPDLKHTMSEIYSVT